VVIDDGRSFEHSVKLQGGRFVEFTLAAGFSLNPFSMIDDARAASDEDYRLDCFAMIKAIIGQMARHDDKPSDTERGLIDRAVTTVWDTLGSGGSIDDIAAALGAGGGQLSGRTWRPPLRPTAAAAATAGSFQGRPASALDDDFTVFEMSDLASREELRSVVLSAIMFMTGQAMTRTSRATAQAAADRRGLVDAAGRLDGRASSRPMLAPRASMVARSRPPPSPSTTTDKSDGARAALENSDWMLILQQKAETIADFRQSARLDMDDRTETLIRCAEALGRGIFRDLHQGSGDRGDRPSGARSALGDDLLVRSRHLRRDPGARGPRHAARRCDPQGCGPQPGRALMAFHQTPFDHIGVWSPPQRLLPFLQGTCFVLIEALRFAAQAC